MTLENTIKSEKIRGVNPTRKEANKASPNKTMSNRFNCSNDKPLRSVMRQ